MLSPAAVPTPESRAVSDMHFISVMLVFGYACVLFWKNNDFVFGEKKLVKIFLFQTLGISTKICAGR